MRRLLVLAAIIFLVPTASGAQGKPDACRTQIPAAIAELLSRKFPQHRLPLVTDGDPDQIEFNIAKGRSSCILVATGDFNGDKKEDIAIGLTQTTGKAPIVAIALSEANNWNLSTVESWVETPQRLYVSRVAPGLFKRFEGVDSRLDRNERESLRCRTDAVVVGATESTGIVYCHVNNQWLHVWVSD